MPDTTAAQADALLLILTDREFLDIGAILGLRARPSVADDVKLIEAFLDSDTAIGSSQRKIVIGYLPEIPPQ